MPVQLVDPSALRWKVPVPEKGSGGRTVGRGQGFVEFKAGRTTESRSETKDSHPAGLFGGAGDKQVTGPSGPPRSVQMQLVSEKTTDSEGDSSSGRRRIEAYRFEFPFPLRVRLVEFTVVLPLRVRDRISDPAIRAMGGDPRIAILSAEPDRADEPAEPRTDHRWTAPEARFRELDAPPPTGWFEPHRDLAEPAKPCPNRVGGHVSASYVQRGS